jgi:hypothetical protein
MTPSRTASLTVSSRTQLAAQGQRVALQALQQAFKASRQRRAGAGRSA